jgi:hypothetical protein
LQCDHSCTVHRSGTDCQDGKLIQVGRSQLIPLQVPQILARNSDLHIVLQFTDQPPFRNAQFVTVMQRVFDSYRLALAHLVACRSLRRLQRGLLTVEFPVHEACPKAQFQLHAEIVWHDGDSLRLLATACRFPRFKKQILIKTIGRKDSPRILSPIPEEDAPPGSLEARIEVCPASIKAGLLL